MAKLKTIGPGEIHAAIERLAAAISQRHPAPARLLVLGIANGGIELARRLALRLSKGSPPAFMRARAGILDISFHRDDMGTRPIPREFNPTQIPEDVDGATVIVADDVLHSGRTVKAAIDELFDHGRPSRVELAVLADRGGHRLPIRADYVGLDLAVPDDEKVLVRLDSSGSRGDSISLPGATDRDPGSRSPGMRKMAKTG